MGECQSKILNVDLVKNPDLALNPKYAFEIMIHGFINGTFSKRKVNGKYANTFEKILQKSFNM